VNPTGSPSGFDLLFGAGRYRKEAMWESVRNGFSFHGSSIARNHEYGMSSEPCGRK
jgi:hypothetical protein